MTIHHGGSGTTAFALAAGIPTLVVPFVFDQFYWGERIAQLGVGPRPIPFAKLSAGALRNAIIEGVGDRSMQQKARQLGERIRAETGIDNAIRIFEQI